jgi:N-acetyl-anhydromuramyl-L-alanine amidase AmpD
VKIYQTLPWDHRCWGVGSGKKGSHNATHIQFEICEDGLTNEQYYNEAFNLAKELCAFLCAEYSINPDNIVGHYESAAAGYGSNHADPRHWQSKFGGSMEQFRKYVKAMLGHVEGNTVTTQPTKEPEKAKEPTKTQTTSGVISMNTLRNGSKGTQVRVLQWLLNDNGYDAGTVDGIFGSNTLNAVKAFQKAAGLAVDGVVGKNTWTKLLA